MSLDLGTMVRTSRVLRASDVAGATLVLCDLDGCLISEGAAYSDARDFVTACGPRLRIISNNSTDTAQSLAAKMRAIGIEIPAEHILLAGEASLQHLADTGQDIPLALYADTTLQDRATDLGLALDMDTPQRILLCRDTSFSLSKLNQLVAQIGQGAELWVANTDQSHPGHEGRKIAETGALLAAVRAVLGDIAYRSIGKPHPHMALLALQGTNPREAIFVGDNLQTDGGVAASLNVPFLHIQREAHR